MYERIDTVEKYTPDDLYVRRRKRLIERIYARWLLKSYQYTFEIPDKLPEQFLLVSNHGTNFDPMLLYLTFPNTPLIFFVGEQMLRDRFFGKFLHYYANPIPVMRQIADANAVREAFSIAHRGGSIALYPAGECERDGHPLPIADSVGKLAKKLKMPLVTFNFEGTYFAGPWWRKNRRHLPTHGRVVGIYGTDELKAMTPDEVTELIRRDLSVDEDAWRAKLDVPTRGKDLAESLETLLYLCPSCGGLRTLTSHGDVVSCPCGMTACYTDRDVFAEDAPFHTVYEWNVWQRGRLEEMVSREPETFEVSLDGVELFEVEPAVGQTPVASGTLSLGAGHLSCGDWTCAISDIVGLALVGSNRIMFSLEKGHFEVRHEGLWNPVLFLNLYETLKEREQS